nr:unnamed protein product [Callosobruchus chinensis]
MVHGELEDITKVGNTIEACAFSIKRDDYRRMVAMRLTTTPSSIAKNDSYLLVSEMTDKFVATATDNGKYVVTLMFAISKAFDSLKVNYIISKLALGLRRPILTWIKSYFANRAPIVNFDQILSEQNDMCLGVPQGLVLGPLVFLLFANDLPESVPNGRVTIFADDATVTVTDANLWRDSLDTLVDQAKLLGVHIDSNMSFRSCLCESE